MVGRLARRGEWEPSVDQQAGKCETTELCE